MSIQDQYIDTVRQSQQAWTGIVESLTENLQSFGKQSPFPVVDPTEAIDQVFDFWEKTLETQREVAKQLVGATVAAGERVRTQAEEFGSVVREQAEQVTGAAREQAEAAREQAEAAKRARREQVAATYEDHTKAQLQDELAARDLPKTGNVDELRARLVADDLS